MKIQFKLLDSTKDIQNKILQSLLPDIIKYMDKVSVTIQKDIPNIVKSAIASSPEYQSLMGGILQYELGIPDSTNKLSGLLDIWTTNIDYQYIKPYISNNQIKSKISASMIKIDFSDVLYTDYAIVRDIQRGYSLPWLEWLLLNGDSTIVRNYEVILGPNKNSRTGFAIMRNTGKYWKVPSQFSGTISDNWITRAIESASSTIINLLERALS